MRRSQLLIKTYKETPSDADSVNASYLIRGSFIKKNVAGAYALLPLGMKVYQKIESIVRKEMDAIGGQEILMNVLQPRDLWDETGRWSEMSDIFYQFKDKRGKEIGLAPTHEEQITDIVRENIHSYKDLPLALYQIQVKFRNEMRAKSGLLRTREFIMKDLYSFHEDEADFVHYYEKVQKAYEKIFIECGLPQVKMVEASGGAFSKYSHEYQLIAESGEDEIFFCKKCDFAQNKEISKVTEEDKCPKCGAVIEKSKAIEVGNIFPLKNKFSKSMKALYKDKNGIEKEIIMGCYGLGLTRLIGSIVEVSNDERGIIWPENVAPYKVNLISIGQDERADKLYEDLQKNGVEVLYDDRSGISAGEKFADADLIGCPFKVIVSDKSIAAGGAEVINRSSKKSKIVDLDKINSDFAI